MNIFRPLHTSSVPPPAAQKVLGGQKNVQTVTNEQFRSALQVN